MIDNIFLIIYIIVKKKYVCLYVFIKKCLYINKKLTYIYVSYK